MNNLHFPKARTQGIVVQEVPDEVLVFDTESNEAHCLNKTAALVWKACNGKRSVSDIAGIIGIETESSVSDDLVWLAIDQLNENRLLETEIASKFAGSSRREALKRIGMASMIALPIIASLAAPKSVFASASCACPSGPGSQGNNECLALGTCPLTCVTGGLCA